MESVAEKMVPRAATQIPVDPRLRTSKQMVSLTEEITETTSLSNTEPLRPRLH